MLHRLSKFTTLRHFKIAPLVQHFTRPANIYLVYDFSMSHKLIIFPFLMFFVNFLVLWLVKKYYMFKWKPLPSFTMIKTSYIWVKMKYSRTVNSSRFSVGQLRNGVLWQRGKDKKNTSAEYFLYLQQQQKKEFMKDVKTKYNQIYCTTILILWMTAFVSSC